MSWCEYSFEIEGDIYETLLPTWLSPEQLSQALDEKALDVVYWCWERSDSGCVIQIGYKTFELPLPADLPDRDIDEIVKNQVLQRICRRVV